MQKLRWGMAALVPLLVAVLASAQPPKSKRMPEGWFGDLMGWSTPKPKAKDEGKTKEGATSQPAQQDKVLAHERIMNAYLRRQAVCLRLLEIAQTSNNAELEKEALALDTMAMDLYRQQARGLGINVRPSEPEDAGPDTEPEDAADSSLSLPRNGSLPPRFRLGGIGAGIKEGER